MRSKNKLIIIAGVLGAFLPIFAFAQATISISNSIPGFSNVTTTGPCGWIVNFYGFALIIAGILAFGAIVYGGIKYAISAGNPSSQSDGRSWIWSALIGLLLLGGAWLILNTINPSLTKCSFPGVSKLPSGGGIATGSGNTGSGGTSSTNTGGSTGVGTSNPACAAPASGPCTVANLQGVFGADALQAAGICKRESAGIPTSRGDTCQDGTKVSIGLFQLNISADNITAANGQLLKCPNAFTTPFVGTNNVTCQLKTDAASQALYQQCLAATLDPTNNIANTFADTQQGTNWHFWATSGSGCTVNGG